MKDFYYYSIDELCDMISIVNDKVQQDNMTKRDEYVSKIKDKISINKLLALNIAQYLTGERITEASEVFIDLYNTDIDRNMQTEIYKQRMIDYANHNNRMRKEE